MHKPRSTLISLMADSHRSQQIPAFLPGKIRNRWGQHVGPFAGGADSVPSRVQPFGRDSCRTGEGEGALTVQRMFGLRPCAVPPLQLVVSWPAERLCCMGQQAAAARPS